MTERDVVGDTIENHRIVKRCIKHFNLKIK